jgi:L-rhamnose mutarotase
MRSLIAPLALLSCASLLFAADLPKYWTVHIDSVADRATFEELNKQEYAIQGEILAAHGIARTPQWKFGTSDGTYFTLRGRASLADIEKPSTTPADVRKEIDARQAPLEPRIHASLRDHHNEIWETDTDVTSIAEMRAAKFTRYHRDVVKPSQHEAYGKVQKELRAALEKHGVAIAGFYSNYGDGAYHYFFLSDQPFDLNAIVPAAVMQQWRECVVASKDLAANRE